MENYYRNYGFFHQPDQSMFYPIQSAYGTPTFSDSGPPGYDFRDFAFSGPTRYYYNRLAEVMYNRENVQWPGNHVQEESDQGPNTLSRFSFAAEDETAILGLDGERNYSLDYPRRRVANQLLNINSRVRSQRGPNMLSFFAPEDETAILGLDGERNHSLANRVQEIDQSLNIRSRISSDQGPNVLSRFSFAAEDETAILGLDGVANYSLRNRLQEADQLLDNRSRISFAPEEGTGILDVATDGFLASFSTSIPVDDLVTALQLAQEDMMDNNNSGLSEATILEHLKTRNYLDQLVQEPEICVVCQCEYENGETVGTLECRHEYHANCIKRWLMKKNVCPLCKREGIQQKA